MAVSSALSIRDLFENLTHRLCDLRLDNSLLDSLVEEEVLELDEVEENFRSNSPATERDLVRLLRTKIDENNFPGFMKALHKSGQEGIAWEFEQPDLSVQKILEGSSTDLFEHCQKYGLDISSHDKSSRRLTQTFLFNRLFSKAPPTSFEPPISVTSDILKLHEIRKQGFLAFISKAVLFVKSENLQKLMESDQPDQSEYFTKEEIRQFSKASDWMKKSYFEDAKSVVEDKPVLLVAGATSAGKSTLLNALLGKSILPTHFDVCTRVLCKIKYDESKYAVVRTRDGQTSGPLSLDSDANIEKFSEYVKGEIPSSILTALRANSHHQCEIDVFWPSPFLKNMVIVDSPGISVDETFRKAVEQFKDSQACGFLFVLDANRAVEEAATVGGLIRDNTEMEERGLSMARVAIFILNKWDFARSKFDEEELVKRREKLVKEISQHWKGFRPEQLIQFDAEFASYCSRLGRTMKDMEGLCEVLRRKVPIGMTAQLFRGIRYPERSLGHVEEVLKEMLTIARMTPQEKKDRLEGDWKNFRELMGVVAENGKISRVKAEMESHLENLSKELRQYLLSSEGKEKAHELFQCAAGTGLKRVEQVLYDTIVKSKAFQDFQEKIRESTRDVRRAVEFLKEVWERSPEANFLFVQAEIDFMLHTLANRHENIGAMRRAMRWLDKFSSAFSAEYRPAVEKLCSPESQRAFLRILTSISEERSGPFAIVYKEIPQQCSVLAAKITAKTNKMDSDIPHIQRALENCQKLQQELSLLKMSLEFHDYDESEVSPNSQPLVGMTEGSTTFRKVKTPDHSAALLCTHETEITANNALFFQRHLQVLQHYRKTDSLLHFYGSVRVSKEPLKFGFVFEGFDKTLAECLSSHEARSLQQFKRIAQFAVDIASGVSYFHQEVKRLGGHGNLRLENILMVDGVAKLGPCTLFDPDTTDNSADIRSLGVIFWEIWNRKRLSTSLNLSAADFARRQSLGELQPGPLASLYSNIPDGLQQKWQKVTDACLEPKSAPASAHLVFSEMKEILHVLTS